MSKLLSPDHAMHIGGTFFRLDLRNTDHGPTHWHKVFFNACLLAVESGVVSQTEAQSRTIRRDSPMEFLCWFAFLHDCRRRGEGDDPLHGELAASLVHDLRHLGELQLSPPLADELHHAIAHHSRGTTSSDPLTGICWDADRLDLPRVGVLPVRELMSTGLGKSMTRPRPQARRGILR